MKLQSVSIASISMLLLLASSYASSEVYKHVDKNGGITFSDQPMADSDEKVVSRGIKNLPDASADSARNLFPPGASNDPIAAAGAVAGLAMAINTSADWCVNNFPSMTHKIKDARSQWERTNQVVINKSWHILRASMSNTEVTKLTNSLELDRSNITTTIDRLSQEEKQKICSDLPQKYASREVNIAARKDLIDALNTALQNTGSLTKH